MVRDHCGLSDWRWIARILNDVIEQDEEKKRNVFIYKRDLYYESIYEIILCELKKAEP